MFFILFEFCWYISGSLFQVAFFPPGSMIQLALSVLVSVAALVYHVYARPFRDMWLNSTKPVVLFIFSMNMSALTMPSCMSSSTIRSLRYVFSIYVLFMMCDHDHVSIVAFVLLSINICSKCICKYNIYIFILQNKCVLCLIFSIF